MSEDDHEYLRGAIWQFAVTGLTLAVLMLVVGIVALAAVYCTVRC